MFNSLGIAQRIYGSFGALIALLAAICVVAYLGLTSVAGLLADFRATADQTAAAGALVDHVNRLELAAIGYRVTRTAAAAKAFSTQRAAINFDDPLLTGAEAPDQIRGAIGKLRADVDQYAQGFDAAVKLEAVRANDVATLRDLGAQALTEANLSATTATKIYDMKLALQMTTGATAVQDLLIVAERYLPAFDPAQFPAMRDQAAQASQMIADMASRLFNPDVKAAAVQTAQLLEQYIAAADALKATSDRILALEAKQVDAIGSTMSDELSALSHQIVARQQALGQTGQDQAEQTLLLLATAGVLALVFGIAMALLIGRSLSRSIAEMARNMRQIAEGDLEANLTSRAQGHELGQMAEALEVFRSNGRAVREMDALKAAEAQEMAAALEQREAVLANVRRVVASALAGDFSGRVPDGNKAGDLRDFVDSLNSVMATVEQGVGETAAVLDGIAQSELSRRVEGNFSGVFERLKVSTNTAADSFAGIVTRLQATSRTLKTATGEMLAGSNELSERTTRQAATIEETSAAMDQLATTVAQTAGKASEASAKTQAASALADEGGRVMAKATEAMERITASSAKISNIIGLIDDVAFQTNLLALNASVEAARAGEAGKGFAVVAVEVRRLAQSAAQASAEVKALIEQSGNEVSGGSRLVGQASQRLDAILAAVRENSALMTSISDATRNQAAAIGEVNAAISSMDEMTQHNAALVEQNNAAIEQAESQSSTLDRIVEAFTLDADGKTEPARAAVSKPAARPRMMQSGAVGALQARLRKVAETFKVDGSAALDEDWQEF